MTWTPCTPDAPCKVCGRDRWCSRNGSALRCTKLDSHQTFGQGIRHTDKTGGEWWLFRTGDDDRREWSIPEPSIDQSHNEALADADTLHKVYSALLGVLSLSQQHRAALTRRGLTAEQVTDFADLLQYGSLELTGRAEAVAKLIEAGHEQHLPRVPGFVQKSNKSGRRYWTLAGSPGMLIPVRDIEGRIVALKIRRDDASRRKYQWLTSRKKRDGKVCGVSPGAPVHVPLFNGDRKAIRCTEGPLKADIATALTGMLTIAIPGVSSWNRVPAVAGGLEAERVLVSMDADATSNPDVSRAIGGLATELPQRGFEVEVERWDEADGKGIDDLLLAGKVPEVLSGAAVQEWVAELCESAGRASAAQIGDRVAVEVVADEWLTIEATIEALASDDSLFQRTGHLVKLIRLPSDELDQGVKRTRQTPKLIGVRPHFVRERITKRCFLFKSVETEDGIIEKQASPPEWLYRGIADRGHWDHIRPITGFTEVPILRADGSVLSTPGYDERSQMVYLCDGHPPDVPDRPTREQAIAARDALMDLFADFPFAGRSDRAAALAGILTLFCRDCIPGCVPLFLVESADAGTGKGLYCDVGGIIATGREMPKMTNPTDVEETRKSITSCLMAGDSQIVLDNIRTLGNAALDKALTDTTWKDRILGGNEMGEWPMRMVFFATGNNPQIGGDTFRRIVRIRMEADCENPSERSEFRYPRLRQHVRQHRLRYVVDALTILRAYFAAGCPKVKLPAFGSFEEWSDLVRQCVVWLGMADPVVSASALASDGDSKRVAFRSIVELWETVDPHREGLTTSSLVKQVSTGDEHERFREALSELGCVKDGRLDARTTGYRFREFKGRVVGEFRFGTAGDARGSQKWVAKRITPARGDDGDDGDHFPPRGTRNLRLGEETVVMNSPPGVTIPAMPAIPAREPEPEVFAP